MHGVEDGEARPRARILRGEQHEHFTQHAAVNDTRVRVCAGLGEHDRLRRALQSAGFSDVHEEDRIIPGRWSASVEEYWEQFTEVAAPFRPLLDQLTSDQRAQARAESLLAVKKFWSGREINLPLEIVIGSAVRP